MEHSKVLLKTKEMLLWMRKKTIIVTQTGEVIAGNTLLGSVSETLPNNEVKVTSIFVGEFPQPELLFEMIKSMAKTITSVLVDQKIKLSVVIPSILSAVEDGIEEAVDEMFQGTKVQ